MEVFFQILVASVPRAALFLGFVWLMMLGLRRSSATIRYWFWVFTLGSTLLIPLLLGVVPPFPVSVPPEGVLARFVISAGAAQIDDAPESALSSLSLDEQVAVNTPATLLADPQLESSITAIMLMVWCAGSLLVLLRALRELLILRNIVRRAMPVADAGWKDLAEDVAATLHVRGKIKLLISDRVSVPMARGLMSPVILLPRSASSWSVERRSLVLLHETYHLARHDTLIQCLSLCAGALYWFNPLVWVAIRRLQEECEQSCDDFVLKSGVASTTYASHLVDIARKALAFPNPGIGVVPMAQNSVLSKRIELILDFRQNRNILSNGRRLVLAFVVLSVVFPIAGIRFVPVAAESESNNGLKSDTAVELVSFAPGDPGSCGLVHNASATTWTHPLINSEWIRGFSAVHSGVDLVAASGTPVYAANGGVILFAGWSSYGYGYTVVIASGPFTTLYSHLSAINVSCGQQVASGEVIGAVGSSGNSSEPHLHFEIRYLDIPVDPTSTIQFESQPAEPTTGA